MRRRKRRLVSIVVGTRNEADVMGRMLNSVKRQSYKWMEVIVVDNGSVDETVRIARLYTDLVFKKGPERSAQRNFGAKQAKGEYLLFLDADMELSEKVVEECVELVERGKIDAVVIPEESVAESYWERAKAFERSFYNLEGDETTDAARFFKKDVFVKLNGYDESLTGPEDWDLSERVKKGGLKIGRIKAKIYHRERIKNLFSLARKKFYYGLKSHRYLVGRQLSPIGPKTIYFLRPVFYKNWRRLAAHPFLALSMMVMFIFETVGGGLGFLVGMFKK